MKILANAYPYIGIGLAIILPHTITAGTPTVVQIAIQCGFVIAGMYGKKVLGE